MLGFQNRKGSNRFTLNSTASVLWLVAAGVPPRAQILERRTDAIFDVAPEHALRDAEEFAEALAGHCILRLSRAPILDAKTVSKESP